MALSGIDGEFAGWVYKQGSLVRNWKKRFMVLRGRQLTYYDTAKVGPTVKAKGSFQVITVELSTDIQNGLLVHGRGGRVLKLYTASAEATSSWYNMILDATAAAPQQFAPPDRFSTLSAASTAKPVDVDDEMELLDRLESLPMSEDGCEQVVHSGWLKKEGARVKSWKRRYFVLRGNALSYFNSEWTYGLPEAPGGRTRLQGATHIANPGCYATGAQLGLMPLLGGKPEVSGKLLDETVPPHVFGLSGYSGAGTNPSAANDLNVLKDNVIAYKSVNHIHEHEISHQLGTSVRFMPHVAPYFQGIHLTLSAQLADNGVITSAKQAEELYQEFFANEALVKVQPDIPFVKNNAYHPHATVGGFQLDPDTGRLVVIATIDNLLKGAATQAVQNINVALGIDEYAGIDLQ
ncbi:hypothetical protein ON010_g14717 [Phytophthora cinnamomi]|nr:hypothetical protein ON010_g14717 [Phytophthora cinnamomi]